MDFSKKSALFAVLGVSILLKCWLIFDAEVINPDGIRYINSAHELMQGNLQAAFAHEKMLAYTLVLGLVHLVVPDWFLAGKILSSCALVLTTIPLYLVTRDLFGARAGLAAGLVFSVSPFASGLATEVVKGPLFLLCVMTSVWLLLKGLQGKPWCYLPASGAVAVMSVLFRIEGLVYVGIVVLALQLLLFFDKAPMKDRVYRLAAFFVFPAGLVLAATLITFFIPVPTGTLMLLQERFGYYFTLDLAENYRAIYQYLQAAEDQFNGGHWSNDFFELSRHMMPLVYLLGLLNVFLKALFPLFLVPLLFGLSLKDGWNRQRLMLLVIISGYFGMGYLYLLKNNFISERYIIIPVVLSLVLVGYGLDRLMQSLEKVKYPMLITSLIAVLCLVAPAVKSFRGVNNQLVLLRTAGEWLQNDQVLSQRPLITNEERIPFYAGLMRKSYRVFPSGNEIDFEKMALEQDCGLIILRKAKKTQKTSPVLEAFELVKEFESRAKKIWIYVRKQ